jgi:hypothetical protein
MSDAKLVILCDCDSPDHLLVFDAYHWDATDHFPAHSDLFFHAQLTTFAPWWKRLWLAAQYVARGRTKKWLWVDTVIDERNTIRLRNFLNEYLAHLRKARKA